MQCNFLALFFLELMAAQPGGNTVKLRLSAQLLPETSKHRENSHHNLKMLESRPHVFIFGTRIVRSRWQWQQKRKAQMRKRLLRVKMLGVQRECVAGQIMINHTMQFKSGDSLPFDWIGRNFELQQSAFSCTGVRFPTQHSWLASHLGTWTNEIELIDWLCEAQRKSFFKCKCKNMIKFEGSGSRSQI